MTKQSAVPDIRSPFNFDPDVLSHRTGLTCDDPSRAKQSEYENTDINVIVKRFNATGNMPISPLKPEYGDFTGVSDYQSALHELMDAQDAFFELPADIRKKFSNNPGEFVDFVTNHDNIDEVRKMGLAPTPPADAAPAANGSPAPAEASSATPAG